MPLILDYVDKPENNSYKAHSFPTNKYSKSETDKSPFLHFVYYMTVDRKKSPVYRNSVTSQTPKFTGNSDITHSLNNSKIKIYEVYTIIKNNEVIKHKTSVTSL